MKHIGAAILILVVGSFAACKSSAKKSSDEKAEPAPSKAPPISQPKPSGDIVQPRIGGDPGAPRTDLGFEIVGIYRSQKPTDVAPYHQDGGKWTFFDAKVGEAQFSFGFESQPLQGVPFERATARLAAANPVSAGQLVTALAGAFKVSPPSRPAGAKKPRPPLQMAGVVLGRGLRANKDGSYSGTGGNWVTCKWTIEDESGAAEFFLNFNLATKRGLFSEKDASYRDALIKALNASL